LKNEQDVHLFERLAFLSRREVSAKNDAVNRACPSDPLQRVIAFSC
jgi:hypothetical protein